MNEQIESGAKIIATHSYTDMDALLGVYLVGRYLCDDRYEVRFYSASTRIPDIGEKVDYIVDFGKEFDPEHGIFDHHSGFEFESAVNMINQFLKSRNIDTGLDLLINYVHWQDLTGNAVLHFSGMRQKELEFASLHNVLSSLRDAGMSDLKIYEYFRVIFDSLTLRSKIFDEVRRNFDQVVSFYNDRIAIVKDGTGLETSLIWDEYPDVDIVIYSEQFNTGVIRRDGREYDLCRLQDHFDEPGWFYHISGFIAARGTKKAPSQSPSVFSAERIAEVVCSVFFSGNEGSDSTFREQ